MNLNRMVGPFNLKDLIIIGGIIVSVSVAMFLMKGYLSLPVVQGLWLIIIEIVVTAGLLILLIKTINGYWKWGKEGFLFATARLTGLPVYIDAELGSSNADFVLGEKKKPKDVSFADEESGVKIDPSMMSAAAKPLNFPLGLIIYCFSYYNYMAQSLNNHAAFKEMEDYRKEIKKDDPLTFLPMKEWVELISCPEHMLEHDANNKLNKYFKQDQAKDEKGELIHNTRGEPVMSHFRKYQAPDGKFYEVELSLTEMMKAIAKQRNDLARRPISGGYLTLTEAFVNNSIAASSQHIQQLMMVVRQQSALDYLRKIDWHSIGMCALMILCGTGVVLTLIFMFGPKAATAAAGGGG